ncbi:MAG: GNAT family N-acetyltransferase [Ruminococcaceae bacterium]|nr:GNAT family N-acetyltransferase [Oscillospiraceae bacterium]
MNDIPAFTECGGVSTLILREIPYRKTAFILVRAFEEACLDEHLQEAVSLCRFAGAKSVFVSAENEELFPEKEPAYKMLRLSAGCCCRHEAELLHEELCEYNIKDYISIYNACFADTISAETFTEKKARTCMDKSTRQCRIYYREGLPAAISDVEFRDNSATLNAIGVLPEYRGGFGRAILESLMTEVGNKEIERLCLDVMSTNSEALRLYEKLGFEQEKVLSHWYKIL